MATTSESCEHFGGLQPVSLRARGCEECLASGDTWTELRACLVCGHVGCCEDSKNAHALRHYQSTGHPIIASLERGQRWGWCYVDRRYVDPLPEPLRPRRPGLLRGLLDRARRR